MLYVPSPRHTPLAFTENGPTSAPDSSSFVIPGWGGVAVLNIETDLDTDSLSSKKKAIETPVKLSRVDFRDATASFVGQLRQMAGFPLGLEGGRCVDEIGRYYRLNLFSSGTDMEGACRLLFLPSVRFGVTEWEIDAMMRRWVRVHYQDSLSTLVSVIDLVESMAYMEVLPQVSKAVDFALNELSELLRCVSPSMPQCELPLLMKHARHAKMASNQAFFDPTMLPQLYFALEHLMAVYLPLWAPLTIPYLSSLVKETKRYREKVQGQQDKQKNE
jgi:phosphatidylinositol glycan class S